MQRVLDSFSYLTGVAALSRQQNLFQKNCTKTCPKGPQIIAYRVTAISKSFSLGEAEKVTPMIMISIQNQISS
jgi:hypothetical protein